METNLNEDLTNKSEVNENFDHKNLERNGENQIEEQKLKPQEFSKSDNDSLKNFETIVQNVEKRAKDNISNVEMLLKSGLLNQVQGEILIQQIIKKGYAELEQYNLEDDKSPNLTKNEEKSFDKIQAITEFEKENPEFFKENGRLEVLNYIKSGCLEFDRNELNQISELIKTVEQSAIDRYLKQAEFEAKLRKTNDVAKSRLNANAQNAKDTFKPTVFTREQIGKMSGAEFTKNEKLIMEQLSQGLIR